MKDIFENQNFIRNYWNKAFPNAIKVEGKCVNIII